MSKELVLTTLREFGRAQAESVQSVAESYTGTELNEKAGFVPDFQAARDKLNMLERPVGFVCKSSAGRVVKLLQVYDSTVYTGEPEDLPAQWGFVWSQEPEHAKEFVALSTSPYATGDCALENGVCYRSLIDNNVAAPSTHPAGWEAV